MNTSEKPQFPTFDNSTDKLLSPAFAAAFLGVALITLATWRSTGRYNLPFIKVGRLVKYRQSDLKAFLDRMTMTQTA